MRFNEYCTEKELSEDVKKSFKDFVSEGSLIDYEAIENNEDLNKDDLDSEFKEFKDEYPEKFGEEVKQGLDFDDFGDDDEEEDD